jgi:choline dehydrogenase
MGITVLRELPVGENLHDHFNTYLTYRCAKPITLNELQHSLLRRVGAAAQYALFRRGPMSGNGLYVGAFFCSDQRFERPDIQMNMFAWSTTERTRNGIVSHPFPGFTLSPVHLRPEGRGTLRLKSPDPLGPPEIRFNFMRSDYDYQALIAGMRMARRIAAQPALAPYIVEETLPGAPAASPTCTPLAPAAWAAAPTRWSIRGCACMVSRGCASPTPPSCRRSSPATPTRRAS